MDNEEKILQPMGLCLLAFTVWPIIAIERKETIAMLGEKVK